MNTSFALPSRFFEGYKLSDKFAALIEKRPVAQMPTAWLAWSLHYRFKRCTGMKPAQGVFLLTGVYVASIGFELREFVKYYMRSMKAAELVHSKIWTNVKDRFFRKQFGPSTAMLLGW